MIEKTLENGVLTLRLAHGKASVLDLELLQALTQALDEAQEDAEVKAVILTGSGSIFSAGVDLKRLLDEREAYAEKFVPLLDQAFEVLFEFPKPVIAAVNGHAIAGGCILVATCDIKLMAQGKGRIGIPELKVGVPFPVSAFEVLRFAIGRNKLQALLYQAETFNPDEALEKGWVDEVLDADSLMTRAQIVAAELGAIPAESFRISKAMFRTDSLRRMHSGREQYGLDIQGRWSSDATYTHIENYLAATLKG
ncbi:MAG: enoyl-CoA hydratase/isomerase family protein [Salinisphaeraceae bacterium]|nr:enoyl-CoA hydratase/isomerase family protein [Salinisphaeraceae bacterium]